MDEGTSLYSFEGHNIFFIIAMSVFTHDYDIKNKFILSYKYTVD